MPIYAYKCGACGLAKDQLQKISDPALTDCPQCGKPSFSKQLSAPGFQLKGSGWYATDFRSNNAPAATPATSDGASAPAADAPSSNAPAKTDTPAATASACAPSCACH
ncbi:MAG: zinc ribbon domain-containing protein [Betaproteobacteria bacterium]|nr:zinc ribbon domain-containing protein [Betaproteobacteria bacterium]